MRNLRWLVLCLLVACGGDDAADPDAPVIDAPEVDAAEVDAAGPDASPIDAAVDIDAALACPTWESCEHTLRPGVLYQDGCAPVACGFMRFQTRDVAAQGESASTIVGRNDHITYVRTSGPREVWLTWEHGALNWRDVLVAPVLAAGPTTGTWMTTSGSQSDDITIWVAWGEADGSISVAHKPYVFIGPQPAGFTVIRNVATGTRPQLHGADTGSLLAYLGPGGIHVRRGTGLGTWGPATVVPADATRFTSGVSSTGFDTVTLTWHTPSGDVKSARSRNFMPFETVDVALGLAPNPNGTAVVGGGGSVMYTHDPGHTVWAQEHPVYGWTRQVFGRFAGQGSDLRVGGAFEAPIHYTSAVGVHSGGYRGDPTAGLQQRFAEEVISTRCGGGELAGGRGAFGTFLVHTCPDGQIYSLLSIDGQDHYAWHQRCFAVAASLADTARSCGSGATKCVVRGGRRLCATGDTVDDMAYAQACGGTTADPAGIGACEAAAASATCVVDGGEGTVTVPAACAP